MAGYHWWLYYKKIKAASIRIDGPKAVVVDNGLTTTSADTTEKKPVEQNLIQEDIDSEIELISASSPRNSPISEDMFHLDEDVNENTPLISVSPTTRDDSTNSASVIVSVVVHSTSNGST